NFGGIALAVLISVVLTELGLVACVIPSFYIFGALAFAPLIAADQRCSGLEAIKLSYATLKPHAWAMFFLIFVAQLASGLGICACGIGLALTFPLYQVVIAITYNSFFPPQPAAPVETWGQPPRFEGPLA